MTNPVQFSDNILTVVGQLTLHASIVVCIVLLIQLVLGKKLPARWRYALWAIVVARLLIPWNYSIPVITEAAQVSVNEASSLIQSPMPDLEASEETAIVSSADAATGSVTGEAKPRLTDPFVPASTTKPEPAKAYTFPHPVIVLFGIWALGVVLVPGSIFISHRRMIRRALSSSTTPPIWVTDLMRSARDEVGTNAWPTIHISPEVHAPTLIGAIRPKILLPENLVEDSSPEEMRLFLLHELTHLKYGDIWFSWLWCIALSLHWFNPLLWWAGTRIRKDRELACDESVLRRIGEGAKDDYAHALLKAVSHITGNGTPRYRFGLAGIAENKSEMERRIQSILAPIIRTKRIRLISALVLTTILCTSFVRLVPIPRIVEAQVPETTAEPSTAHSAFIQSVDAAMKRIKARIDSGNAYADKSDLTSTYAELKTQNSNLLEEELVKMIGDLGVYEQAHFSDDDYVWRIEHLKSVIARDTKDEIVHGEDSPSFIYLWEATLHYPHKKHSNPSKHSKFQHLVNELGMLIWDRDGLDAAEKYVVDTWKSDRRFEYFFEFPWSQRMQAEGISLDRLKNLQQKLGSKAPLERVEFILTPQGLTHHGNSVRNEMEIKALLTGIGHPSDHFVALGISTEDISLKKFRDTERTLVRLTSELKFAHFSDIGLQTPDEFVIQQTTSAQLRARCANNLKQLALAMKMFANESRGERFPSPDRLSIESDELYPEYVTDSNLLLCPADDHAPPSGLSDADLARWHFAHSSYWYIGHAVTNDEEGQAYFKAYRKIVEEGDGNLDTDFVTGERRSRKESLRLREGIERFFITDINDPHASAKISSTIPVMIERTDKHGPDGGNVLFLDGHVEYIKYPGKFPMTEAFIEGLQSLDALE